MYKRLDIKLSRHTQDILVITTKNLSFPFQLFIKENSKISVGGRNIYIY